MRLFRLSSFAVAFLIALAILPLPKASGSVSGQMVFDHGVKGSWDETDVGKPSILYTGTSFIMWYGGFNAAGVGSIGLATSSDGINWLRDSHNPVLAPGQAGAWDASSIGDGGAWVIQDSGQYKMWYDGSIYAPNGTVISFQIGYASSSDGITWSKNPSNPVLTPGTPGSFDDMWVYRPVIIKTGASYLMYYSYRARGGTSHTATATSSDGIHWAKAGQADSFLPTQKSWDSDQRFVSGVTKVGSVYVMAYYGASQYPNFKIGFATSNDGTSWTAYNSNPVIQGSTAPAWDDSYVWAPTLVAVADKYYVYYAGTQNGQGSRIGLAILPSSQYALPEFEYSAGLVVAIMAFSLFILRPKRLRH